MHPVQILAWALYCIAITFAPQLHGQSPYSTGSDDGVVSISLREAPGIPAE